MPERVVVRASSAIDNVIQSWRSFRSKLSESGFLYTAELAFQRLVPDHVLGASLFFLCERPLDEVVRTWKPDPEIHRVMPEEFDSRVRSGVLPSHLDADLKPGVQFWILEHDHDLIAYMWLTPGDYEAYDWLWLRASPRDITGVRLWVAPRFRGQGIGPRMNRHVASECLRAGYARIVSNVDCLNRNSLRGDEKVGYRRLGRIFTLTILGFKVVYFARTVRFGRWNAKRPLVLSVAEVQKRLR